MSTRETPIRIRVHPGAENKSVPVARSEWPDAAVIVHSILGPNGELELGCVIEMVHEWPLVEHLVVPGLSPTPEVIDYCSTHQANVHGGCYRDLRVLPTERLEVSKDTSDLGYMLRDRSYRKGRALVSADTARQLCGVADHWAEMTKDPGSWSIALRGLGRWVDDGPARRYRKFRDAPRIKLVPTGDHVLAWWGTTAKLDDEEVGMIHRPFKKAGPIVDILAATGALAGISVRDLAHACEVAGIEAKAVKGSSIDRLRAETLTVMEVYIRCRQLAVELGLGLDMGNLISTGGITTALLREMEGPR